MWVELASEQGQKVVITHGEGHITFASGVELDGAVSIFSINHPGSLLVAGLDLEEEHAVYLLHVLGTFLHTQTAKHTTFVVFNTVLQLLIYASTYVML